MQQSLFTVIIFLKDLNSEISDLLLEQFSDSLIIYTCETVEDFFSFLSRGKTDILILDIFKNKKTGYSEILENLKKKDIFFLTRKKSVSIAVDALKKGARDYILIDKAGEYRQKIVASLAGYLEEKKAASESGPEVIDGSLTKNMLATVVHELRSPINSILGYTTLLLDCESDKEKTKNLNIIQHSSKYLLNIVNDILDYSKIAAGKLNIEPMNFILRNILDHVFYFLEIRAKEKQINFKLLFKGDLPTVVFGDELRFSQVLINIISNAIKFTDQGGKVRIICSYKEGFLIVKILDNGIGIPRDKIRSIFSAFEQVSSELSKKEKGTGLGLAITYNLVKLMAGKLSIQSTLGRGTIFTVELPFKEVTLDEKDESASSQDVLEAEILEDDGEEEMENGYNAPPAAPEDPKLYDMMVKEWIKKMGNNKKLQEISLKAIRNLPKRIGEINLAVNEKDEEQIKGLAHKLKGFTGTYRMGELYEILIKIDELAMQGNFDFNYIQGLMAQINSIVLHIPEKYFDEDFDLDEDEAFESQGTFYTGNISILVADDMEENRNLLKAFLEKLNLSCQFAQNGKEVLEQMSRNDFDILFLDMQMPVLNGYETLDVLSKDLDIRKDIFIIALTADARKENRKDVLSRGCDYFLAKPIELDKIKESLDYYFKKK